MDKIKIVFVIQELVCGGAEQALFDLVCLMDKSRFDVTVLVITGGGVWEGKFKDAGIRVINIFTKRQKGCSLITTLNHQLRKMKLHRMIRYDPRSVVGSFFSEKIDIVVSYSLWGEEAIALAYGSKHIKFIHGNIANNKEFRKIILDNNGLLSEYHRIICVSDESYHAFMQITGMNETVKMHYNPLNSENVCRMAEQPVKVPCDQPYICAVGRLSPEKGYERLIRIHKRIIDEGIHHRLIIVGDGPERNNIIQVIRELNVSDSVITAGYQINPYPYMKQSRFLVCSSFTEGLPVIAMEALSLGIPIVSAIPSIGEIFGAEVCGIITENDDESLEAGITKMLSDEVYYESAKRGAGIRRTFFEGKRMVKELENVFVEVVEGK